MVGIHSQYYHINIANGWNTQPVLPYKYYAGMHGQYYHIYWDAQPVLPHGYHMNTQNRFFQQLGHIAILNDANFSQSAGMHSCVHCTIASPTTTSQDTTTDLQNNHHSQLTVKHMHCIFNTQWYNASKYAYINTDYAACLHSEFLTCIPVVQSIPISYNVRDGNLWKRCLLHTLMGVLPTG